MSFMFIRFPVIDGYGFYATASCLDEFSGNLYQVNYCNNEYNFSKMGKKTLADILR